MSFFKIPKRWTDLYDRKIIEDIRLQGELYELPAGAYRCWHKNGIAYAIGNDQYRLTKTAANRLELFNKEYEYYLDHDSGGLFLREKSPYLIDTGFQQKVTGGCVIDIPYSLMAQSELSFAPKDTLHLSRFGQSLKLTYEKQETKKAQCHYCFHETDLLPYHRNYYICPACVIHISYLYLEALTYSDEQVYQCFTDTVCMEVHVRLASLLGATKEPFLRGWQDDLRGAGECKAFFDILLQVKYGVLGKYLK